MRKPKDFISCDWGTTNFRLRMVELETLEVKKSIKSSYGVKRVYNDCKKQVDLSQKQYFAKFLMEKLEDLEGTFSELPIVLTGMASSSIGLMELPYAPFPFKISGKDLVVFMLRDFGERQAILTSGISNGKGLIRGEESQAIGLEDILSQYTKAILLLPGTHSKHLKYERDQFTDFDNYMTGELFEVLSSHSILKSSLQKGSWNELNINAFEEGLLDGFSSGISVNLLKVRTREVMKINNHGQNYFYLSGILIGDELKGLKNFVDPLILLASEPIRSFYKNALALLFPNSESIILSDEQADKALLRGQRKILSMYGQ